MQQQLIHWFKREKRDLPWREVASPYHVWVSEVMLQQTQVSVVIPYYLRWIERFPTIKALAEADRNEVIKMWEGLGYYSRARNLHEGAKQVYEKHSGILPHTAEALSKIKGIGPYTQGAILSFAFHLKAAAVDGNVIRVLARYFAFDGDMSKPPSIKAIWKYAEELLPENESWIFNEGLIELGATICTKTPKCAKCPIKSSCQSFARDCAAELPFKSKKNTIVDLVRHVAVIECQGNVLVRKCPKGEIMEDLYEFPFFEVGIKTIEDLANNLGLSLAWDQNLSEVSHGFTKYRVKLLPAKYFCEKKNPIPGYQWVLLKNLLELPFNSGHRRILQELS